MSQTIRLRFAGTRAKNNVAFVQSFVQFSFILLERISSIQRFQLWFARTAEKPAAKQLLFALAFCEASVAPLPPDYLLVPLSINQPRKSFSFASVAVLGSVLGSAAGYLLGLILFDAIGNRLVQFFGFETLLDSVLIEYSHNAWPTLILAGFTPIPFQVFTIAAGVNQTIPFMVFIAAAFIGRAARFLAVAGLFYTVGPKVNEWLKKNTLAISFVALLALVIWFSLTYVFAVR